LHDELDREFFSYLRGASWRVFPDLSNVEGKTCVEHS
jgi:hypothetical protein